MQIVPDYGETRLDYLYVEISCDFGRELTLEAHLFDLMLRRRGKQLLIELAQTCVITHDKGLSCCVELDPGLELLHTQWHSLMHRLFIQMMSRVAKLADRFAEFIEPFLCEFLQITSQLSDHCFAKFDFIS